MKIQQTWFISAKTNKAKKVVRDQTFNGNILMLQLPQKWVAGKSNFARHKTVIFDGTRAHNTYTLNQVPCMDNICKGYAAIVGGLNTLKITGA